MSTLTQTLPQLTAEVFLADGGIETTLIYEDGIDLPDFAAFVLLDTAEGRAALIRYFERYAAIAADDRVGVVLETPTWRASRDWGARLGYDDAALDRINRESVDLVREVGARFETPAAPVVVSGCLGPRGDGYQPGALMSAAEAHRYHAAQARSLARGGADLITAITIPYPAEAVGIALAARDAGLPAVISFTVETDGHLPTGDSLASAITAVDEATDGYPAYYMVTCAHPTHFADALDTDDAWTARLGGIRANASRLSHEELDAATELDPGDVEEFAELYAALRERHPQLTVLGGCCGTNHAHVAALSARNVRGRR